MSPLQLALDRCTVDIKRLPNYAWYVVYSTIASEAGPEISPGEFTECPGLMVDLA